MHLIITRPQPDAEDLQRKLEVRGHSTFMAPLLDIRVDAQRPISNRPYQGVLITSANGARAYESSCPAEAYAGAGACSRAPVTRCSASRRVYPSD